MYYNVLPQHEHKDVVVEVASKIILEELTLSKRWMIKGTRLASMTACTCCWFPAVMFDRNHTASYRWHTQTALRI